MNIKKLITKKIELKVWVPFLLLVIGLYCYSNLQYSQRYNIIIENHSEGIIDKITFVPGRGSTENLNITHVAPNEHIKISRDFENAGDNFLAIIDTLDETEKVIPLAYIYSPESINIVKLIINDTKDGKITNLTVLSFDNGPSIIPGWIRSFYDYAEIKYEGTNYEEIK